MYIYVRLLRYYKDTGCALYNIVMLVPPPPRNARMMSLLEVDDPRVEDKYIALVNAQLTNYMKW